MASNRLRLNAGHLMRDITIQVTVDTKALERRLWIAKKLFRLAAWVLDCRIQIEAHGR